MRKQCVPFLIHIQKKTMWCFHRQPLAIRRTSTIRVRSGFIFDIAAEAFSCDYHLGRQLLYCQSPAHQGIQSPCFEGPRYGVIAFPVTPVRMGSSIPKLVPSPERFTSEL